MMKWMKKLTVLLITILTLGLYVPPIYIDADADVGKDIGSSTDRAKPVEKDPIIGSLTEENVVLENSNQLYLRELNNLAKNQLQAKLGTKISAKIDTEVTHMVVPNLETVLEELYEEFGEAESQYLMIADEPSDGYGERIFNLYHSKEKENVAKFHVNRLKKPQDGYYFQFHYHLQDDQFEAHLPIAEVYWGKNTPPKWMA
ncbi:YpjP family protein [Gracilibacillus sp. S3-1-1]|uniref:YpjP family protein n=1 Tax=Gracilibacillus pellucidus TaxID=3095368 RepID=A0ACC6M615_9BACI|nr:YpjP family protein [Gracilibacillus sp. S3-1-1]MDX8046399.1 YpjP family protein [Gracilibacillus sp. S3-1-1]